MIYSDRKYVILTAEEAASIDFSKVLETNADTLRFNEAGTHTLVKYVGNKPTFLYGKDTLTHAQILEELAKEEWTPTPDPLP